LTVAALQACGLRSLEKAPAFQFHLATGDSLLHGGQLKFELGDSHEASDGSLSGFTYSTEDLTALRMMLEPGRYDSVVGNPPYITVKDKALNEAYRRRYATCLGQYAMTVPFMERFFDLAKHGAGEQPAGWVGQITSNSFMKREFGVKIIEQFLSNRDLRLVVDTSGAYIPGHGTPTVIIVGRNQSPTLPTVRTVLGVNGEPGRPEDPANGVVWQAIVEHTDDVDWEDRWVTVADLPRRLLAKHPWSLTGGGAVELMEAVHRGASQSLGDYHAIVGRTTHTGSDECFYRPRASFRTQGLAGEAVPVVIGEDVRDFVLSAPTWTLFPYDSQGYPREPTQLFMRQVWPLRTIMQSRLDYEQTLAERGLRWFDHSMFFASRFRTPLSIAFASVATHNHFALDRGGKVFKQSAPVIKLPAGTSEDEHFALLGVLNSSTACFWLKQNSHNKGSTVDSKGARQTQAPWEDFYDFAGKTLLGYELPRSLPIERGRILDRLAREQSEVSPYGVIAHGSPTRQAFTDARAAHKGIRSRMIAQQEELDWEVYRIYGLTDADLTYRGPDLPTVELGERAFEIALARAVSAGEETTAWFERHRSIPITNIPSHWPPPYRELVQRRLDVIAADPAIRLLEKPEYKRRWAWEPWENQEEAALRGWLLDRLEDRRYWFDPQGRPSPKSVARLADDVVRDLDLIRVLALWDGRPDVPPKQSLTRLLEDEAVPYLAAYRYKDSGLAKHQSWEATWVLQRREDAGEPVGRIPTPPNYSSADFRKMSYWNRRGKLDVPKERFILYSNAGRDTDPTPLLGWAGWDHAQQALAISQVIAAREADGWSDDRLVPLVAGLAELQPWVEQWHAELDPKYGVSLAAFCREQLTQRTAQIGRSVEELQAWRPDAMRTRMHVSQ
jgi:hypothetical protein